MKVNPVVNYTLIIRSQAEYSAATQTVILRCILEKPVTGQRQGFTDVEALLAALHAELMEIQNQMIPPDQQKLKNSAGSGIPPAAPDPAPLTNAEPPTASGSPGGPKDTS